MRVVMNLKKVLTSFRSGWSFQPLQTLYHVKYDFIPVLLSLEMVTSFMYLLYLSGWQNLALFDNLRLNLNGISTAFLELDSVPH